MASATMVSAPLDCSAAPARMRSIAARIQSRSSGAGVVIGVLPGGDAGAVVPAGLAAEPVGGGLRDVRGLGFQGECAFAELGGLLVRAMLPQPGTQWSRRGVSSTPSGWHRARSRL